MRRFKQLRSATALIAALALIFACANLATAMENQVVMVPANFAELAKEAKPGVVNIRTVKTIKGGGQVFRHFFGPKGNPFEDFFGPFGPPPQRDYKQRSLGSGFIIDKEGYIVTNNHVVEGADKIRVSLYDENEYDAKVVGRDPKTDLALIKIDGAPDLHPLPLGDSDKLEVGDWVLAIGSPFGLEQTVTAGIVSAKKRVIGAGPYDNFIQTDASINPGNSGGPLLDLKGEVVGINTAIIASGQGIGFAIPINMARSIVAQLKEKGSVTRGWLGVAIQNLSPELADYYGLKTHKGVMVTQVFEGDPADKAGIKPKDIIVAVDGHPVSTGRELSSIIANTPVGKKTKITLLRNGKRKTVTVKVAKREDEQIVVSEDSGRSESMGIQVAEITPERARQFGLDKGEKGVLVMDVQNGSRADEAGLRTGDIIKEVNHERVADLDDFRKAMRKATKHKKAIQMLVKRRNHGFKVVKIKP